MTRAMVAAEFTGTAILLVVIVGSGIAVETLGGSPALQLFVHATVVGAGLAALIAVFIPVSGAHFNPAVTLAFRLRRTITTRDAAGYVGAQILGGLSGTAIANLSFGQPPFSMSTHARTGLGLWLSEAVATAVLVGLILLLVDSRRVSHIPLAVGAWVATAIVATSSTGFANPAVAIARTLTDTYTGIAPLSVPIFVAVQLFGAFAATTFAIWITSREKEHAE